MLKRKIGIGLNSLDTNVAFNRRAVRKDDHFVILASRKSLIVHELAEEESGVVRSGTFGSNGQSSRLGSYGL